MPRRKRKTGNPSWKPAGKLETTRIPGYRVRYVDSDPAEVDRKVREGWVMASEVPGIAPVDSQGHVDDQKDLTSLHTYRELVLMALPEDVAAERDKYFEGLTNAQTVKPVTRMKQQARKGEIDADEDVFYEPEHL